MWPELGMDLKEGTTLSGTVSYFTGSVHLVLYSVFEIPAKGVSSLAVLEMSSTGTVSPFVSGNSSSFVLTDEQDSHDEFPDILQMFSVSNGIY